MATVVFRPTMALMLESPRGDVAKYMRNEIGRPIEVLAKRMVGVRTGALKKSIHTRVGTNTRGVYVEVGSPMPYALRHHTGTRPHLITPKPPGRMLRFQAGGRVVYAKQVRHPGTRPNPYLTVPLRMVVK